MAITREKKAETLSKLKDIFSRVSTAVFVNFHGMSVGDTSEMRRALHGEKVSFFVAKKTLIKKALAEAGLSGDAPDLPGEIAVAYPADADSSDVTAPARGVYAFEKKFEGRVGIVGGIFDRMFRHQEGMLEIATIPSQRTLHAMFVNVINAPIQGFVVALSAIAEKKTE